MTINNSSGNSSVKSEVDLDFGYIENVLTDYDSQHLQKQESTRCKLGILGHLSQFNMASKRVAISQGRTVLGPYSANSFIF